MEEMFKCHECDQWVRSFSGNDCKCHPQKSFFEVKKFLVNRNTQNFVNDVRKGKS